MAMGNSVDELKERTDPVTTDANDNGIGNACVKLGLIKEQPARVIVVE